LTLGASTKGDEASIGGIPLLEAFRVLVELKPGPREIWGFGYSSPWPADIFPYNVPPGPLDHRVAVLRRSHGYSPPRLYQWPDGGFYISCSGDGVELRLDEGTANEFIAYIRELRWESEKLAGRILMLMQQGAL